MGPVIDNDICIEQRRCHCDQRICAQISVKALRKLDIFLGVMQYHDSEVMSSNKKYHLSSDDIRCS